MLTFDQQGLIPVVIQDERTGQVLMLAFMNDEALRLTRSTGYTHLFSRSRQTIWRKGEQSGHVQEVHGMYVNCEENSLLLKVVQQGPGACHTGHHSCYYRQLLPDESYQTIDERTFDPTHVYAQPNHAPLSQPEQASLEADMRQLYTTYTYLRDHDLSAQSNTSRLLQERNYEYLVTRVGNELQELADVQTGAHVHKGRQEDTILEASQVGYWLILLALAHNLTYDEIKPHTAIFRGHRMPNNYLREHLPQCLHLLASEECRERVAGLIIGFTIIGRACAEAGVSPLAPAQHDLCQMQAKDWYNLVTNPEYKGTNV